MDHMRWQPATIVAIRVETMRAKTFRFRLPSKSLHRAGQHYIVRLTAADGYTTTRSYSIASAPQRSCEFELTVERLADGEVSGYLHEAAEVGDVVEVRGPVGGWFVWDGEHPALLIGGGSGVVPLMSMLRMARETGRADLVRMIVSVRSPRELLYAEELHGPDVVLVYTRESAADATRPVGRLTADDLPKPLDPQATIYVCGSSEFVDAVASLLMVSGAHRDRIRIERFGVTGYYPVV